MGRAGWYFIVAIANAVFVYVEHKTHGAFTGWCIYYAAFGGYFLRAALLHAGLNAANKSNKAGW